MKQLKAWLKAQFDERKVEPNPGLGVAITYLLKHWDRLTLFLQTARSSTGQQHRRKRPKDLGNRPKPAIYESALTSGPRFSCFFGMEYVCSLRRLESLSSLPPMQRSPDEQRWVEAVTTSNPQIATAEQLAQQFRRVFSDRDPDALTSWLAKSVASDIPELKRFVAGIQRDYEAIVAAVQQHWSNGQVEGQVHRLKLLKRQMYGRSGFPLLRRRVLPFRTYCSQRSP